jgi:hypothetical protein
VNYGVFMQILETSQYAGYEEFFLGKLSMYLSVAQKIFYGDRCETLNHLPEEGPLQDRDSLYPEKPISCLRVA